MRELARIQFRGDTEAFEAAWNAASTVKIEYGVVALYKDETEYENMRQLFAAFAQTHNTTWFERVDVKYSEQELESFELLTLHITGQAGEGNNELAAVYAIEPVCGVCGRIEYRQVRDLVLDFLAEEVDLCETGYFQHDLCKTDFHEVVVSPKVATLLDKQVPGVEIRPIEHVATDAEIAQPYYQLIVEPKIGPLVEPTRIQRLDLCEACGQYKQVLLDAWPGTKESEFYFLRSSYAGEWIMKTVDRFGRLPKFAGELVINQRLYRLLRKHDITGFWVQPAYLID